MWTVLGAIPTALTIVSVAGAIFPATAMGVSEALWGKTASREAAGMAMSGVVRPKLEAVKVYAFDDQELLLTKFEKDHLETLRHPADWQKRETVEFLTEVWEAQERRA